MIQPTSLICRPNICGAVFAQKTPSITKRFVYSTLIRHRRTVASINQPSISPIVPFECSKLSNSINKVNQTTYTLRRQKTFNFDKYSNKSCLRSMTIPAEPTNPFHCVHVYIKVVPGMEDAFMEATLENARASSNEEGVLRFDVYRDQENINEFVLVEVYKDSTLAPAQHKETSHYLLWRDTVAPMMAEERTRRLFNNLFPTTTEGWAYPSKEPLE